uniref:Uncharacterized protein n=1 Tax=Sphaerodactylus townsendi TaxID=933632 RepID=A0ACB8F882_9SAUR
MYKSGCFLRLRGSGTVSLRPPDFCTAQLLFGHLPKWLSCFCFVRGGGNERLLIGKSCFEALRTKSPIQASLLKPEPNSDSPRFIQITPQLLAQRYIYFLKKTINLQTHIYEPVLTIWASKLSQLIST